MSTQNAKVGKRCFSVVTVPTGCNAFQIIQKRLLECDPVDKCVELLDLKEQTSNKYDITLIGLDDPKNLNDFMACVNGKAICIVELPLELPQTSLGREIAEGTLSHILSSSNGHCHECEYEGNIDCSKINFEKILLKKVGKEIKEPACA